MPCGSPDCRQCSLNSGPLGVAHWGHSCNIRRPGDRCPNPGVVNRFDRLRLGDRRPGPSGVYRFDRLSPRRLPSRSERRQPLRPSFASATAVQVRAASTPSTVFASATTVQVSTASTVFASATALAHTHRRPDDRAVLPVGLADIAHRLVMRRTSSSTMGTRSKASLSWGTLESRVETPIAPFGTPSY